MQPSQSVSLRFYCPPDHLTDCMMPIFLLFFFPVFMLPIPLGGPWFNLLPSPILCIKITLRVASALQVLARQVLGFGFPAFLALCAHKKYLKRLPSLQSLLAIVTYIYTGVKGREFLLGPLPCVLEGVICHHRVTLWSQAFFRDTWYYYNIYLSSSVFFFLLFSARFRVPVGFQLPVVCKEKKKAARPVLRMLNPNGFRIPPRLGIGWKRREW